MRIGIVQHDRAQAISLQHCLISAGYTTQYYQTKAELVEAAEGDNFDALVVGSTTGDETDVETLNLVRRQLRLTVPVIMIAPNRSEQHVVSALQEGADDYIPSPIRRREFLARVEAVMRSSPQLPASSRSFEVGRLQVDISARRIRLDGKLIKLTIKDFDLAVFLLCNVGRLMPRAKILRMVWGWTNDIEERSRTLNTHISRVRIKLALDEANGWRLTALYGVGYRLDRLATPERARSA
jgi:DNA-binding response OmpR family regulator